MVPMLVRPLLYETYKLNRPGFCEIFRDVSLFCLKSTRLKNVNGPIVTEVIPLLDAWNAYRFGSLLISMVLMELLLMKMFTRSVLLFRFREVSLLSPTYNPCSFVFLETSRLVSWFPLAANTSRSGHWERSREASLLSEQLTSFNFIGSYQPSVIAGTRFSLVSLFPSQYRYFRFGSIETSSDVRLLSSASSTSRESKYPIPSSELIPISFKLRDVTLSISSWLK